MELSSIILAAIGIIVAAGATTAYFARSRGSETIKLLQTNIQAYKDAELLKDAKILLLQGQLKAKDEVIDIRDQTIERLIKNGKK